MTPSKRSKGAEDAENAKPRWQMSTQGDGGTGEGRPFSLRGEKLARLEDGDRTEESTKKESVFLSLVALVGSPSKQVQGKDALGLMRSGDNRLVELKAATSAVTYT